MNKLNSISEFSIIMHRGYGSNSDCNHFASLNHPQLIQAFIDYVNLHKDLIGLTKIESRQSLGDMGCDIYVELKNKVKIGVQIKSPHDVSEEQFAMKVKAQYTDTRALSLDKYYILICCPMSHKNELKVNSIVSYFALLKTNYHAVLNPNNCIRIFNPSTLMAQDEFIQNKQLFSSEEDFNNLETILKSIQHEIAGGKTIKTEIGVAVKSALDRPLFQPIASANKFIDYLQLDNKIKRSDVLANINEFITKYGKLSDDLKSFYFLIIKESSEAKHNTDALEVNLRELDSLLRIRKSELLGNINVLASKKYELIRYDEEEPNHVTLFIWLKGDYNFIKEIKNYATENLINIENIFIKGNFALLDQ